MIDLPFFIIKQERVVMNKWIVNALYAGSVAALAMGMTACDRSAGIDAGASSAVATSVGAPMVPAAQMVQGGRALPVAAVGPGPRYARVVGVEPVRESVGGPPHQVCHDQVVTQTAPPRDQHQIAGTAIGAVLGGVLGHQVGSGKGRTLATVAGAVGGGYAGNRIEASRQHDQVTSTVQRRCSMVSDRGSKVIAYDVRYEYNGAVRTTRMDHDPGSRVQVQEGVVAVSDAR